MSKMSFVLSLDEGTSSARAALYDRTGSRVALQAVPIDCRYPQPGWVEQDAQEVWDSQLAAARATLAQAGIAASDIDSIGITNQRETVVVWDIARPASPSLPPSSGNAAVRLRSARDSRHRATPITSNAKPAW
jgi:glycerol kinase